MSISLNDHENRIKTLEKGKTWIAGPVVNVVAGARFSLPSDYDDIILSSPTSEPSDVMFMYLTHDVIKMCVARGDIRLYCLPSMYHSGSYDYRHLMTLQTTDAINFVIERNEDINGTFKCWYTKRGGGYKLRNFVEKISSLYQNTLKTISLTILGGEVI